MNREGQFVVGPSRPSTLSTLVDREVYSQSSMNSHRCVRPISLDMGISWMMSRMALTTAFLYSKPPSSRRLADRKLRRERCLLGNLRHSARMACTTMTLNSSPISRMKLPICFIRRSTLASAPVFRSVVMAYVATLRFTSVIKFSRSELHTITAVGYWLEMLLSVRAAAKRRVGLEELRNTCRTVIAGVNCWGVTFLMLQMLRAASNSTRSFLWRRQDSTYS
mmetsp:Transcript_23078/g.57785  ORF Transcript_23078/g.57785 Transcript_23078/m.57785 type:complete len:222 (+) Transcript_23078:1236-1901(+)